MAFSAKESGNVQEVILHAQAATYLGVFMVSASQIKPHPFKQQVETSWVQHLKQCFIPGMDWSANQIKGTLTTSQEEEPVEQLVAGTSSLTSLPHLPEDIQLFVFDGQHQIAACFEVDNRNEHWWVVRLCWRSLEYSYPAEFIGKMHLANNPALILETSEAIRLKGMYWLQKLLEEKQITQEVYCAEATGFLSSSKVC